MNAVLGFFCLAGRTKPVVESGSWMCAWISCPIEARNEPFFALLTNALTALIVDVVGEKI